MSETDRFLECETELVLDSIDIVASLLVCQGDSTTEIQIDSVHHFNRHYVSVICGRSLSVYSSDGDLSSLSLLDTTRKLHLIQNPRMYTKLKLNCHLDIDNDGLFVKHIKLYDSIKEETLLFVLVLTPDSLDVYSHNQVTLLRILLTFLEQCFESLQSLPAEGRAVPQARASQRVHEH